ncbi:MAG: DNA mismatch repair protein MutS, partial [Nanoarchaeota archaeon]|nr:DNA mismatch repair protein MutS [Nanoarchaeota archaeon]
GLVKRGLVRIVTPGTVIESSMLQETENNYILALKSAGNQFALAFCDLSTGEFLTTIAENETILINEITRLNPSECVIPASFAVNAELIQKIKLQGCFLNATDDYFFQVQKSRELLRQHFNLSSLDSFGLEDQELNIAVCGGLLHYLIDTQKNNLSHIKKISTRSSHYTMLLDSSTFRNLELMKSMKDQSVRGTLLSVLDKTTTAMGARLLRKWLTAPLLNRDFIEQRLAGVEQLTTHLIIKEDVLTLLDQVYDLERLISRINYGNATPRDLLSLKMSLQHLPAIKEKVMPLSADLLQQCQRMDDVHDVASLIEEAVRDDAPLTIREGGIIKSSYHRELAHLHDLKKNSKHYLQQLEEQEREKTGIQNLKIGYTKVFGYFIEVTRKNLFKVPTHYIRKQTTVNAERYITEELKREEEKILGAEEKIVELEYALFQELLQKIAARTNAIQDSASKVAILDVLCSLATLALEQQYSKPVFVDEKVLQIKNGRHPVVEIIEPHFISNDVVLDAGEMMVITGPNMAGKSTIMRQTALIVLLAQIGSFVPADECVLGIVDRIFTRVGAYDDLTSGQSTFMVEMNETAAILNNATENSLIILDEIGRGTSTFDGVSIAWSVAEYIHNTVKAKTLFATHYHVMNKLAAKFQRVKNYNVAVKEVDGSIIFLRKLCLGGTDQSYGIHVAKLAGLPSLVISRAEEIQRILQKDDAALRRMRAKRLEEQMSLEKF